MILLVAGILYIICLIKRKKLKGIPLVYFNVVNYLLVVFIVVFICVGFINGNQENKGGSSGGGFYIDSYNVTLDVKKNNKIYVTEYISTDFYVGGHHGIERFIPSWLEYTGKDKNTIKRKSNIKKLKAIGDKYSIDTVNKKKKIRIGNPNRTLPKGEKNYTISYIYDMGKDPFKGFDEFIFHAFGDYWSTDIKNASITINMPTSVEDLDVEFFTDKYRYKNITEAVDIKKSGNTITAMVNYDKLKDVLYKIKCPSENCDKENFKAKIDSAITVDIVLPEGYFEGGSYNYGAISFLIILLNIFVCGVVIYSWFKHGRNYPKRAKTVEFYSPDNLDAATIGYYSTGKTSPKQSIALIVSLAGKGYIKINELDDDIEVVDNYNITGTEPALNDTFKRIIKIRKENINVDSLDRSEKSFINSTFKSNNEVEIDEKKLDKFLTLKDNLVNKGCIKVLSDNINEEQKFKEDAFKDYQNKLNEFNQKNSEYLKKCEETPLTSLEEIMYKGLFIDSNIVKLKEHKTLYYSFLEIDRELNETAKKKIIDTKANSKKIQSLIITGLALALNIVSYMYIEDLNPKFDYLYFVPFYLIPIEVLFIMLAGRRTKYGEEILPRIEGFKEFLEKVEKEQLEALVSQNPHYFYDILPYTYALGISKKWIKKFEDIIYTKSDMGTFDYSNISSYNSLYYSAPRPVSSSSGGSSGGGSCSSCGGGCSSCGGGGSW